MSVWVRILGALLFTVLIVTDLRTRRIPNIVLLLILAWGVTFLKVGMDSRLMGAMLVAALFVPAWQVRNIGGGDVKLLLVQALVFGMDLFLRVFIAGGLLLGVMSILQLVLRREDLRDTGRRFLFRLPLNKDLTLPFGVPFSLSAAWLILFFIR